MPVDEPDGGRRAPAAARAARAVAGVARAGVARARRWNDSSGARESGLARLVELHAWQTSCDAFITVALAGSLFFTVPTAQARAHVGLYLVVTMAPFAVLAPVLGPLLDRFVAGRRLALAATMAARALLALVLAGALSGPSLSIAAQLALYPAALGVLVAQKTYTIVRSAAVPRLLPPQLTLVQANARLTVVGVLAPGVAAGIAVALTALGGHPWALRVAAAGYAVAAVLALRLPRRADGGPAPQRTEVRARVGRLTRFGQPDRAVGAMLRTAAAHRWLAGFLLFYGAFCVEEHRVGGLPRGVVLGALAVAIAAGNFAGTVAGSRLADVGSPRFAPVLLSVSAGVTIVTAVAFALVPLVVLAFASAAAAALAKLALDATIQHRTADSVRTSTFARSETTLQLAWVLGGAVGIVVPTRPALGFALAAAVLVAALAVAVRFARRPALPAPAPAASTR